MFKVVTKKTAVLHVFWSSWAKITEMAFYLFTIIYGGICYILRVMKEVTNKM